MAKKRAPKRNKASKPRRVTTGGLDRQALEYARILGDPCNAPLAHPLYVGADGGVVGRFETDTVVLSLGTTTAGAFIWTPGAIGVNGAAGSSISQVETAGSSTGSTAASAQLSFQPGITFLSANASGVRCVAACLQVYYPGSEQNRAGYITYGKCSGAAMVIGSSYSADSIGQLFQASERMPADRIDIIWKPMDGDQQWTNPSSATPAIELARKGAVGFAVKGIAAGSAVRVRLVAVYEYLPLAGIGMSVPYDSRNMSNNSLDQVVNYLDRIGGFADGVLKFGAAAYRAAGKTGNVVRAVQYASKAMPALMM